MDCPMDRVKSLLVRAASCRASAAEIEKSPSFIAPQYRKKMDDYYGRENEAKCPDGSIKAADLKAFMIDQMLKEAASCEAKAQATRFEAMRWITEQQAVISREIREYQERQP